MAIIAVIIVIVAITAGVVGYLLAIKTQMPVAAPVVTQPVAQAPVTQSTPNNGQIAAVKIVDAKSLLVDDFLKQYNSISTANADFIKIITNYKLTLNSDGKHSAMISLATEEINPEIIYFVKEGDENDTVYSLNLKTNELKELYKSMLSTYDFDLIGIQNSKLLFQKIDQMDSPDPCYNSWVDSYENPLPRKNNAKTPYHDDSRTIQSLDINNPSNGFTDFVVPKDKYDAEVIVQKNCQYQFEK